MTPDASEYVRVIRQLPRPTLAQTERFARFVSGAHSWYKHLSIRPKAPFVFYLDPGAGMNLVRTPTGETALLDITDESTRFHYTWQKTEDYRRRFGYWTYHAAYGTSFLFAGEGGMVSTAGAGLRVLTELGTGRACRRTWQGGGRPWSVRWSTLAPTSTFGPAHRSVSGCRRFPRQRTPTSPLAQTRSYAACGE